MQVNWIDFIILLCFGYAVYGGWKRGFVGLIVTFVSLLGSMWLALRYHSFVGKFLETTFGLPSTWMDILGFLSIGFVSQFVIEIVCSRLTERLPAQVQTSKTNSWVGSIVSLLNSIIVIAYLLLLFLALPMRGTFKNDIHASRIGSKLVAMAQQYGGPWTSTVENIAQRANKFLTVEPGSRERIPLDIGVLAAVSIDAADEQAMVKRVNTERTSRGMSALTADSAITKVAEAKSRDMLVRKYFSHADPEGKTVFDHMTAAGVTFTVVGENLAYAPDVAIAHQGLMNSTGHRENILDPRFRRIGIGVIDGGIYGKMFTQEFTD